MLPNLWRPAAVTWVLGALRGTWRVAGLLFSLCINYNLESDFGLWMPAGVCDVGRGRDLEGCRFYWFLFV